MEGERHMSPVSVRGNVCGVAEINSNSQTDTRGSGNKRRVLASLITPGTGLLLDREKL